MPRNPALPISNQAAIYYGDAENEAALKRLGVGCVKGNPYDPNGFLTKGVVILGRNAVPKEMRERFRKNFEAYLSGGHYAKGIIVCLPGAPLDLLPVPMSTEKKLMFRAELPANDPLFAGMTEADFYFRTARQLNAVKAPDWTVAARPAVLARTGFHQGGAIIYVGFTPDMFEDAFWNREKATRIWNTLFANLNLPLKQNLSLFGNTRMRHNTVIPKLDGIELVDGSLKLDWKNDGKLTDTEGFKPYKLGTAWEKQGFMQRNPHYQYPANASANLKKPYDGWAWIRVKVTVPADWKKHKIRLIGGPVDDEDITYFNGVKIGGGSFQVIAGPCSIETKEQITEVAEDVKRSGAAFLRGGAFKPRTSPYAFQGLHEQGLDLLLEAKKATGLPVVTEIMSAEHLPLFDDVDIIQVGARNMQNFELLKVLGKIDKPILLKRGLANTLDELLMSAEYIMAGGNEKVILCERGIRTFETSYRNTLDISAIPMLKKKTHLPVIVDPSHAAGIRFMVEPLAMAAIAAGADGLMIEVHNNPEKALCDGAQSLTPEMFDHLMKKVDKAADFFHSLG